MGSIKTEDRNELISILEELIITIENLRKIQEKQLWYLNEEEAKTWLVFLRNHRDKEELKSLEEEIADRLVNRFATFVLGNQLDIHRIELMERYLTVSNEYLK